VSLYVRSIRKIGGQAAHRGVDGAHDSSVIDDSFFAPSYNVAPQSFQPVVRLDSETGGRGLEASSWPD
jgi:hypothetical protein